MGALPPARGSTPAPRPNPSGYGYTNLNGDPLRISAKQHAADVVGANRHSPLQRMNGSCNLVKSASLV
jgi:hypothetical protein